jgi:hypothetical protein
MTEFFIGTAIIIAIFAIALSRERHRERLLKAWVAHHAGAAIHRSFEIPALTELPAAELVEKFVGRPALGLASAMEIPRPEGKLWLVEYRTTPLGAKTDKWFTLVAKRFADDAAASAVASSREDLFVSGPWVCRGLSGLITIKMLDGLDEGSLPWSPP